METSERLTLFSRGSGCGCKIAPADLESMLAGSDDSARFERLLVGHGLRDDAAAYDLGNGSVLLSTADFFTPVVDDPVAFGKIAAANALSDIYAMGGRPLFALALLGWPVGKLSLDTASEVMAGGREACSKAGIPIAGGHTIDSAEPFFGLAVQGMVAGDRLRRNDGAQPGDVLFLTKPLGTGIISAAARRDEVTAAHLETAVHSMSELNSVGEALARLPGVHAMTDVTGFGLMGHLAEMCRASGVSAELNSKAIPLLPGVAAYSSQFIYPDMTMKVYQSLQHEVSELDPDQIFTLCDPQTNGGLLVAADSSAAADVVAILEEAQTPAECLGPAGCCLPGQDPLITVK